MIYILKAAVAAAISRNQKKTLPHSGFHENEWDKMDTHITANVGQSFDASESECSQHDDSDSLFEAMDNVLLSPSGHTGILKICIG